MRRRRDDDDGDRFRIRWAVNVSTWNPDGVDDDNCSRSSSDSTFARYMDLIEPREDRERVRKYRRAEDRKRALVSRLMVRAVCKRAYPEVVPKIKRTKGGKPFLANRPAKEGDEEDDENFNFNVAHDGDWVVLCADGTRLCGIDVCGKQGPKETTLASVEKWFELFETHFSRSEWAWIRRSNTPEGRLSTFRLLWSCKEAFTKARGDGLGCELSRCTFEQTKTEHDDDDDPIESDRYVRVDLTFDGVRRPDWMFESIEIQGKAQRPHWITIARGPPTDIVDAFGEFTRTFRKPSARSRCTVASRPFEVLTPSELASLIRGD